MTDDELIAFTDSILPELPDGYGFWCVRADSDDSVALLVEDTEPPMPPGKLLWIARELAGGRIIKGALLVAPDQDPAELRTRALVVVGVLELQVRRDAHRFN